MKKILRTLPLAVAVFVALCCLSQPHSEQRPLEPLKHAAGDVHYTKLVITGETVDKGIYDPTLAYTPDGRIGWLAYSSVKGDGNLVQGKVSLGEYVSTHLARTTDGGGTWTYAKALNVSADGTLVMPDGKKLQGVWRFEVPSLVYDGSDPDAHRRWKLFAHRYFWERDRGSRQAYAWIVLRTAADPAGQWSEEIPLLGAGENPPAPYHLAKVDVNALDRSLKNTVVYTEPGALAHEGRLYLSLTALRPQVGSGGIGVGYSIILLASDDHGRSWSFMGTLLTAKDANHFGYEHFDGTALAVDGERVFLLAVPGGKPLMHDGCVAFEFETLAKGRLKRDAAGFPVVSNYFAPQPGILSGPGAGQATYDARNTNGGLIMAQFNLRAYPNMFQIFQTRLRILFKAEPSGAANRSQPQGSYTNRTSAAAGSGG